MITCRRTGHMYYGTGMEAAEGSDNCGTCNGAGCMDDIEEFYQCRAIYTVTGVKGTFDNIEDAKAAEKAQRMENVLLVPTAEEYDVKNLEHRDFWLRNDGQLMVYYFRWNYEGPGSAYIDVECDPDAPTYWKHWAETAERWTRWLQCTCTDKTTSNYETSCGAHCHCDDWSCFWEMQNKGRTEKKWYM